MGNIKIGCTLFCFTSEYINGTFSFADCVRTAKEIGAEGYEIVATQMVPSYPFVSDAFAKKVKDLEQKYGIGPACYAANMDRGMLRDRDLSEDEMLAMAINDLYSAKKLGCKVVREQYLLSPRAMVRLAPYAEDLDIRVGIEIHNPETPCTPAIMAYREAYDKCRSPYLGFVPDFGMFAVRPNKPMWDRAIAAGESEEILQLAARCRMEGLSQEEAAERLKQAGAKGPVFGALAGMYGFVQFRRDCEKELQGLKEIMPVSFEMHAKCHYVSESLEEASIPYEKILPVIDQSSFSGYIMAEFENEGDYPSIEMTRRNLAMMNRILGRA